MLFNSYLKFVPFVKSVVSAVSFDDDDRLANAKKSLIEKLEAMTKEFSELVYEDSEFVIDPSFVLVEFKFNQLSEGVYLYNEVNRCYSIVDVMVFNAKIDAKGNKFKTSETPLLHFQMSESEFSSLVLQTNSANYSAGTIRSFKGNELVYDRSKDPIAFFLKDKVEYALALERSSARFFADEFLEKLSKSSERIPSEIINTFMSSVDNYNPLELVRHSNFALGEYRSALTSVLTKTSVDALFYAKALKESLISDKQQSKPAESLKFLDSIEVDNFSELERLVLCIAFSEKLLSKSETSFDLKVGSSFKVSGLVHPKVSESFSVLDSVVLESGEKFLFKKPIALLSAKLKYPETLWDKSYFSAYDPALFSDIPYVSEGSIASPVAFQLNILEKAETQSGKTKARFKKNSVLDSEYSEVSWLALQAFSKSHHNAALFGGPCSQFVTFELSFAHSITERCSESGGYTVSEGVNLCSFSIGTHELLKALRGLNVSVPASLGNFGHLRFNAKTGNNSLNRLLVSNNKATLNSDESLALLESVSVAKEAASDFKRSQTKKAKEALISAISNLLTAKAEFESALIDKNKKSVRAVSDQALNSFNFFLEDQLKGTGLSLEDISSTFSKNLLQ